MESELNHCPTSLEFFLVQLIFPFKDFHPFWIVIFKNPYSTSCKPFPFWDQGSLMDCMFIYFFISQFLSFELPDRVAAPFFNCVEVTSLEPGEPRSQLSCDHPVPTTLQQLCAVEKLPTTQDLAQLYPNSDCPFLPVKGVSEGKAWPLHHPSSFYRNASSLPTAAMRALNPGPPVV